MHEDPQHRMADGWHYTSWAQTGYRQHNVSKGVALCNKAVTMGRRTGDDPPADACHKCLAKLEPGWRNGPRGNVNHYTVRGTAICNSSTRISGFRSPLKPECRRCLRRLHGRTVPEGSGTCTA